LNSIFHLRTDYLFNRVRSEDFHAYLSGFLIGMEIKDAAPGQTDVVLCGSDGLVESYACALTHFGIRSTAVSAEEATIHGLIATQADR
ncbi:MAG: 2-dehydro-3-deoxygalactonokinase, partial [Verrucomicrobiota bacterium]